MNKKTKLIEECEELRDQFSEAELFHLYKLFASVDPVNHFIRGFDIILEIPSLIVEYTDKEITREYNELYTISEIRNSCKLIEPESLSTIDKKVSIFNCYATQGLFYKVILNKLVKLTIKENYIEHSSNYPEIAHWILRIFELALETFEKHLSSVGVIKRLHRGWYWFERARLFLITGHGEMAYSSLLKSKEEDINTFGHSSNATSELNNLTLDILNKINEITPIQKSKIEKSDIDTILQTNPELDELIDNLRCITFCMMHISTNYDQSNFYRIESNFRLCFTITENIIRRLVEKFTEENIPNFDWMSLGALKYEPRGILIRDPIFPSIYGGFSYLPLSQFRNRGSSSEQFHDLKNNLSEFPKDFNPIYSYNIISRARNLFLHNFILNNQLETNEIRQIVACIFRYIIHLSSKLSTV